MMYPLALALLLSGAAPQDTAAGTPAPAGYPIDRWVPLDGVAIVVNSDPVTQRALERVLVERMAEEKVSTFEEQQMLIDQAVQDQVEALLMRQAGEDLGFAQEVVDAHISSQIEDRKEESGGIHDLANQLRQDAQTREQLSKNLERDLYEVSFKSRVMGYGGSQERSGQDRYVRPGVIGRQYRHIRRTGLAVDALVPVGATAATYELQVLLLTPESHGSLEAAQRRAITAREALTRGVAEWEDLLGEYGDLPDMGRVQPLRIEDIRLNFDPGNNALVQFVMEGREDLFSPVLPFPRVNPVTGERRTVAYALYKLVSRRAAQIPDYGDAGVQKYLRRYLEIQADEVRMDTALDELMRSAYIWHTGSEEKQAALDARQAELEREIEEARRRNAEYLRQAKQRQDQEPEAEEQAPPPTEEGPASPGPPGIPQGVRPGGP